MVETRPFLVNGEWRTGEGTFEVHSPYDGSVVAEIAVPTAADVEEASQVAHDTFEESKNLPIWARADALDHISKRLSETIEENANLIAAEGGKPLKWATVEATRAVSTFRWASEVIRHGTDEAMRLDTEQALGSRLGLLRRFPLGSGARHHALQLPVEPGGPQGGALARGRSADRGEAGQRDADRCAAPRRVLRRDRPAQGHVPGAAGQLQGRGRHGARRPVQEDLVHGIVRDRLVPQGPGPEEARDARARRQRRRHRPQRRGPGLRRSAHRVRRLLPGGTELHQRAAGARRLRGLRRLRGTPHQAGGVVEGGRPDGPDRRRRSGDPSPGSRAHPGLGRRGRQPGRARCSPAAPGRVRSSSPR